ncbi:MAG: hypothetical protein HYX44_06280 [Aquabacterium sp.]|nr:hypothetical protein [Aquabacterium sp.]
MSQVQNKSAAQAEQPKPWWRYPIVWMVIGGPAIVVVASIFTASLAIKHVDPVLDTSVGQVKTPSEAPAIQARNHSAEQAKQPADQ